MVLTEIKIDDIRSVIRTVKIPKEWIVTASLEKMDNEDDGRVSYFFEMRNAWAKVVFQPNTLQDLVIYEDDIPDGVRRALASEAPWDVDLYKSDYKSALAAVIKEKYRRQRS